IGGFGPEANDRLVYENDVNVTWTATDKITLIGEANYTKNDLTGSSTYGAVGYVSYQTQWDWLKINGRAEVFRDNNGGFVNAYPGNFDFVDFEHGYPNTAVLGPPATYLELTAGLNITPTLPTSIPFVKSVIFRPEVRYDSTLNGATPFDLDAFDVGHKTDQVTIGGDVIVKF
ncbi:MAG TPA: outer membrane beta-barrel protein, partial [Methylovirgula sp.]